MASIVGVQSAEVVLTCGELEETVAFFTDRLGFRLDTIMPADDPDLAVLSGHGLRLRLVRGRDGTPAELRLTCDDPDAGRLVAPNGTVVQLAEAVRPLAVPALAPVFELTRASPGDPAVPGRAGMRYRDLLPNRQGGRFIASHIAIPDGGPVPDYVHHHDIRVQIIYCHRGWVRVVYEDQGPPFVLEAGDCVLQPPGIRHRVLESSAGLEVIEVTCPAAHPTHTDHDMSLPTPAVRPDRAFDGQYFVHHRRRDATWSPWRSGDFLAGETRIGPATSGLAGVRVVRATRGGAATGWCRHDAELAFWFVTGGAATLELDGRAAEPLGPGDSVAVPPWLDHALTCCSDDLELLEVTLPDRPAVSLR